MKQPDYISIPMPALGDRALKTSDKIVLGYVYWLTKQALMKCVASNSALAELCGVSSRNIQLSLERLEQQGYVRRIYADKEHKIRLEVECLIAYSAQVRSTVHTGTKQTSQGVRSTVHHTNTILTNTDLLIHAEQAPDLVSKLYYQYLKKYRIPVRNHNTLNAKIKEMEALNGAEWSVRYLTFMLNDYHNLKAKYKPEITESLDLYNKSKKIETLLIKDKTKQEIY